MEGIEMTQLRLRGSTTPLQSPLTYFALQVVIQLAGLSSPGLVQMLLAV